MPEYQLVENNESQGFPQAETVPEAATIPLPAEVPQETPVEAPAPEATPVTPETPAPEITPTPAPAAVAEPEVTTPAPTFTEEDHIKALGLDPEEAKSFITAMKGGKDTLKSYLDNYTADYDKIQPLDLIRMDFDKKFATLDKSERDSLWEHTLETKYNITGDPEADKFALLLVKAEAEGIRSGLKAEQANYKLPEIKLPETTPQVDEAQEQRVRQATEIIENHPDLKALEVSPILKLGTGEDVFNYPIPEGVNPRDVVLKENLLQSFWKEVDGKPQMDMNRYMKTCMYSKNPEAFEQALINHGKSIQAKSDIVELDNPAIHNVGGVPQPQVKKYEVVKS